MSSIHNTSSSKKKYAPLFADNDTYEYDSSPPMSPVRLSAARTRVRKGPAPERLEDSDENQIGICKGKAPEMPVASVGLVAVIASAPRTGDAEDDPNLSGLSPPRPSQFIQPFPLAWQEGFHVVTAGSKVGITAHWAVAQDAICCERPCHKKLATFALAVEYYGICHAAGVVQLRPARPLPRVSPASPGHSPDRKRQRTSQRPRMFARRSGPPPRQPFVAPINWASTSAGTAFKPISVPSSPVVGGSLLPGPIIASSRPIVLCSDSDSDDPGYSAARPLFPLPNPTPAPTTLDPCAVFTRDPAAYAHDADDSGDDASIDSAADNEDGADGNENESEEEGNGPPSSGDNDSAITISDDDSAITISDDDNDDIYFSDDGSPIDLSDDDSPGPIDFDDDDSVMDFDDDNAIVIYNDNDTDIFLADLATFDNNNHVIPALHITTNPATPVSAISSSLVVEDGSDSDWGFSSIEDPDLIQAIGRALDDPFGLSTGDGRD